MKYISIQTKSIDFCSLVSWSTFLLVRKYLKCHLFCLILIPFLISLRGFNPILHGGVVAFLPPYGFSSAAPRVISRGCWNFVTCSQIMRHLLVKKEFSIALSFSRGSHFVHECSANFRSHFARFWWFFVKTARNRKVFAQNCDFLLFWILLYLSSSKFWGGGGRGNFQFSADFH